MAEPVTLGEMFIFIAMKFNKSFPIAPRFYLELPIVIQLHNKYIRSEINEFIQ
jgi:hypothetical protein